MAKGSEDGVLCREESEGKAPLPTFLNGGPNPSRKFIEGCSSGCDAVLLPKGFWPQAWLLAGLVRSACPYTTLAFSLGLLC